MTVYKTRGVCSRSIEIELDGDTIASVKFNGGCNGNTKGIASLVKGMKVNEVIERLKGTDCGGRGTSCFQLYRCRYIEKVTDSRWFWLKT